MGYTHATTLTGQCKRTTPMQALTHSFPATILVTRHVMSRLPKEKTKSSQLNHLNRIHKKLYTLVENRAKKFQKQAKKYDRDVENLAFPRSTGGNGLRPPAGRQYGMSISQQPLNRSLPNFQQLLLMSNEGKVESFSSFAYG